MFSVVSNSCLFGHAAQFDEKAQPIAATCCLKCDTAAALSFWELVRSFFQGDHFAVHAFVTQKGMERLFYEMYFFLAHIVTSLEVRER